MNTLTPFQFETHTLRVQLEAAGQSWFNARDVCDVLDFGNPRQALESHVDTDDVQKLDIIAWAEALPYSRNGHSSYQILWNPEVTQNFVEVAS